MSDPQDRRNRKDMSDYSRLISYIYSYEKGIKTRNAGFARVELQGERCKINISLRIQDILVNETEDNALEVFMFTRQQGKVYKSHIGRIRISNGNSQFRAQFKNGEIGEAGLTLDEVAGIFICSRAFLAGSSTIREVYASEWDDTTIYVEEFESTVKDHRAPSREVSGEAAPARLSVVPQESQRERLSVVPQESQRERLSVVPQESQRESLPAVPQESQREKSPEVPQAAQQAELPEVTGETPAKMPTDVSEEMSPERSTSESQTMAAAEIAGRGVDERVRDGKEDFFSDSAKEQVDQAQTVYDVQRASTSAYDPKQIQGGGAYNAREVQTDGDESAQENVRNYEKELQEMLEKSDNIDNSIRKPRVPENRDYFQMLCNCYPHGQVAGLGECIKITPHDISYLPKKYWHLCNNNFLLNGYYNFRYLFLCEQDGERNGDNTLQEEMARKYLICVPGFMRSREKNMARMYGFNRFIEKEQSETEQFGYWCMYL